MSRVLPLTISNSDLGSDQILRGDRLVGIDMPVTPGQAVVGQVVKAAQHGDSKMREGEHVAGERLLISLERHYESWLLHIRVS